MKPKTPQVAGQEVGVDIGTAFMVAARPGADPKKVAYTSLRNCFLVLPDEQASSLDIAGVPYSQGKLGLYVLGNDAVNMAGVLGEELRRPLSNGFISAKEEQGKELMQMILENILLSKDAPKPSGETVAFSVPGPVFKPMSGVTAHNPGSHLNLNFHRDFFKGLLANMGFNPIPVNEAVAITYCETATPADKNEIPLTALSISFGAGMTNVALTYRSMPVKMFSIPFGGDYIDRGAAETTASPTAQITLLKERGVDLLTGRMIEAESSDDAQTARQAEAISLMYRELLNNLVETTNQFFALPTNRVEIKETIPVIISGGTTMSPQFDALFQEIFMANKSMRFRLLDQHRRAASPLDATARGALQFAKLMSQKA